MPVSAWKEMVGLEASVGVSVSSSASLTTSMQNNCLHTNCAPMKKTSSQWKHCPSLRHCVISASDRRRILDAGLATDEADTAEVAVGVGSVADAGGRDEDRGGGRADDKGGGRVDEDTPSRCS
jgi:hypothetical protein